MPKRRLRPGIVAYTCPYCGRIIAEIKYNTTDSGLGLRLKALGIPTPSQVLRRIAVCPHCGRRLDAPELIRALHASPPRPVFLRLEDYPPAGVEISGEG